MWMFFSRQNITLKCQTNQLSDIYDTAIAKTTTGDRNFSLPIAVADLEGGAKGPPKIWSTVVFFNPILYQNA